MKYPIRATDGDIGHVHALLADDETWAIRYLIVETSNWWLGHQVLRERLQRPCILMRAVPAYDKADSFLGDLWTSSYFPAQK
jgi:hypothetical protein